MRELIDRPERNEPDRWFLKAEDGSVYGPADIETLKAWCLDGRIEPDSELSMDRRTWVPAPSVPELEMDWLARMEDGTRIGPFPLALIPGLVENGILAASSILEHRATGETRQASVAPVRQVHAGEKAPLPDPSPERNSALDGISADVPDEAAGVNEDETGGMSASTDEGANAGEDDGNAPDDDGAPLSNRMESLQHGVSDARSRPAEARQALQQLRAEQALLKDNTRHLGEELAAAQNARRNSEQLLREQQDRATAAEAEAENLKAQLDQIQEHYDRLQLENQSQFEQIDGLRAGLLEKEQRFKRDLAEWQQRTEAKTELLAGAVQVLLRDDDLARHLHATAVEPPAAAAEAVSEIERLKTALKRVEQQLERERAQARHQMEALSANRRSPAMAIGIALLALLSIILLAVILAGGAGRRNRTTPPEGGGERMAGANNAGMPTDTAALALASGGGLDLQPDTTLLPEPPSAQAAKDAPDAASWPVIALPRAAITRTTRSLRIVFQSGLFSAATRLTPEAEADLISLAAQLRGRLNGFQLMIEGHADATPVLAGGSRYVDNFALGMARAEAVKNFLAVAGNLPAEAMRTSSAGDASPLFSNDTESGRMKNRTAVLTLTIR